MLLVPSSAEQTCRTWHICEAPEAGRLGALLMNRSGADLRNFVYQHGMNDGSVSSAILHSTNSRRYDYSFRWELLCVNEHCFKDVDDYKVKSERALPQNRR